MIENGLLWGWSYQKRAKKVSTYTLIVVLRKKKTFERTPTTGKTLKSCKTDHSATSPIRTNRQIGVNFKVTKACKTWPRIQSGVVSCMIIFMKKLLHSDWLKQCSIFFKQCRKSGWRSKKINHAFHLYYKCCMWIEFQSISTWLRGFSPGTPVSSLRKNRLLVYSIWPEHISLVERACLYSGKCK